MDVHVVARKQVDQLGEEDQNVICRFLDMAVRHNKLREIVGGPFQAASQR